MSKRKNTQLPAPKHGGGPKTEEGKKRSALNSLRHGLTGATVVLPTEDPAHFQGLLDDYMNAWQPANPFETDLVHELAVCRWRLMRILGIESWAFEITMERNRAAVDKELHECRNGVRTALSFMSLAENSKSLPLILRYERQLTRRTDQLIKELQSIQKERKAAETEAAKQAAKQGEKQSCETNSPRPVLVPKPLPKYDPKPPESPDQPPAPDLERIS